MISSNCFNYHYICSFYHIEKNRFYNPDKVDFIFDDDKESFSKKLFDLLIKTGQPCLFDDFEHILVLCFRHLPNFKLLNYS